MHKRKKLFPRGCGLFCCVCLWRRQFHTKKQGHKDICGQFFFHDTQRKQVLYFSINWNTCPISMCYKDKSFTGERSKASNYKLFSLKKKSALSICCHQSLALLSAPREQTRPCCSLLNVSLGWWQPFVLFPQKRTMILEPDVITWSPHEL